MNNNFVSVVIPTYNGEKTIANAIQSVLNQTHTNFELIIVDDGSIDGTKKIISSFQKKDKRIKYFYEKNSGGPAKPKNFATTIARGDYIAYLDHDDEWLPEKLQKQIDLFCRSDAQVALVGCDAYLIDENGKNVGAYTTPTHKEPLPWLLFVDFIYSNSSVMIKKSVVDRVGSRDEKLMYAEDWDMWIRIISAGYSFGFVRRPLIKYRLSTTNTTNTIGYTRRAIEAEKVFFKHKKLYDQYEYSHRGYFKIATLFLIGGDQSKSRLYFKKSIQNKKTFFPSYLGFCMTWGGRISQWIIKKGILLFRIVHGQSYK